MWWKEVPTEVWTLLSTVLAGLGGQLALTIRWRRTDKLRAEKREEAYQAKIISLLGDAVQREKEYTKGLLEHAQSTTELRLLFNRVTDLLEDVAQFLKDSLRRGQ